MTTPSAPSESTWHDTQPHRTALGTASARSSVLHEPGGGGGAGGPPVSDSEPQAQCLPDTQHLWGLPTQQMLAHTRRSLGSGQSLYLLVSPGWHFSPVGRPDKELANLQMRRNEVCYAEFCHPPLSRGLPCCFPYFLLRVSKIQLYIYIFLLRNQCRFYSEKYGGKQERNNKHSIGFPSRIALATFC